MNKNIKDANEKKIDQENNIEYQENQLKNKNKSKLKMRFKSEMKKK